jgi:hypothetical protein
MPRHEPLSRAWPQKNMFFNYILKLVFLYNLEKWF